MEQVKIFVHGTSHAFDKLESVVNDWLAENHEKIEIISRHVTGATGVNIEDKSFVNCTITIFYRLAAK